MGIATGEAELRDRDYFGTVPNRTARVMAGGHGGQILLADSTAGLLSGVDLLDLGPPSTTAAVLPRPTAASQNPRSTPTPPTSLPDAVARPGR
jgi:class 3 adenylate cyclase